AAKLKKLDSYVISPYPDYKRPTPEDCKQVVDLLSELHGEIERSESIGKEGRAANCGEVPSVMDALVRTVLSQNTTGTNSTKAMHNLHDTFGKNNWQAVDEASVEDVIDAIRVAGLAPTKAATIKDVVATAKKTYGKYSLDHLHEATNEDAMREMISFKGVGQKTASCVLLFCMKRDSFAVDTHVFRLAKSLGWVPQRAGREETFGHLDIMIPGKYKYPLHCLLITHGRKCGRC
ncbi:DNA glycosylase, partial [Protomyces lactucae-debilis]